MALTLVAGGGAGVLWWSTPSVGWLEDRNPATVASIERNREAGGAIRWTWVPLEEISPQLLLAILVSEDIEFFQHGGFSFSEIRAALGQALERGERLRGASTLTQQLAKNLFLSPARTAWRKLREAVLAWKLERALSKRRILELYVNLVEFSPGVFGAEAASQRWYGVNALWLSAEEAASLSAGLSRPSRWNPGVSSTEYRERVALIRGRMDRAVFLWRHLVPLYRARP